MTERARTGWDWLGTSAIRRLLRRGAPVSLANAIQLLNYRVDLLVVTAMLPLSAVGRYSVAMAAAETLLVLSRSIGSSAFNRFIRAGTEDSMELLTRVVRHSVILLTGGSVVVVGLAAALVPTLLGQEFHGVVLPLALLVPGIVALGTAEHLRLFFLVRRERSREYLASAVVAMTVNLLLAVVLVPRLGLAGAALSTTVSYCVGGLLLFWAFARAGGPRKLGAYVPRRSDLRDYRRLLRSFRRGSRGLGARPVDRGPSATAGPERDRDHGRDDPHGDVDGLRADDRPVGGDALR
jgi:O-antigen/teichoic acid export membrane protein